MPSSKTTGSGSPKNPKASDPAVFLDRDGVLNYDFDFVHKPSDLVVLPGVVRALSQLKDWGYRLVIVTNQSGVARGYYSLEDVARCHRALQRIVQSFGGPAFDDFQACPHRTGKGPGPYSIDCRCRKPGPGMIEQASEKLAVDLERSFLVGDKRSDIDCALNAGIKGIQVAGPNKRHEEAFAQARDLLDAVRYMEPE